ncbi:LysM peptidoglycan-binding domain-containing protein [Sporosarcina sp. ANT_H38]|uniref:LysM peptidoglycan-binding domain-containing protein n=1 Tax=Sporosarcina sp. ANT_H38 TaxID=2597358 RepID=UPI0011F25D52|nr:LysM peptidoglycan-binding domain-containing protein [Sporosarcina sp. ANT_H38]KAA0944069.1 LysM peptidoglycan-binding domain-containing protein [Sporosarcina sp. ANT_H38]
MHGIYFSVKNDSEGFRLSVNPEKVEVVNKGNGEVYDIAKLGNVNIPKSVELKEFSVESFFPAQDYHFLVAEFLEPAYYIEKYEKWQEEKLPVRYIYVNGSFAINEIVTIENFTFDESFGTSDVNFSLSLKKYVPFGPKKMIVVKKPKPKPVAKAETKPLAKAKSTVLKKATPPRQNAKQTPQTYSLIKGDSLWKVAQKYLGNGNRYGEIAKLNGIKASDYKKLPIGLKVKLPPK